MDGLNNSKVIAGVAMLMLNIGSRYVQADLGKFHEQLLSNPYVKKLIVFSMFFVATRDLGMAFLLTILYIIIIDGVLHENRKFSLIPKHYIATNSPNVSDNEYKKAKEIIEAFEKDKEKLNVTESVYETYINNLSKIR